MGVAQYPGGQARQVGGELSSRDRVGRVDAEGGTPVAVGAQDGRLHFQYCAVAEVASRRRGRQVGAAPSQIAPVGVISLAGTPTRCRHQAVRVRTDPLPTIAARAGVSQQALMDWAGEGPPQSPPELPASPGLGQACRQNRDRGGERHTGTIGAAVQCVPPTERIRSASVIDCNVASQPRNWSADLEPGPPATPSATSTPRAHLRRAASPTATRTSPRRRDGAPQRLEVGVKPRPGGVTPGSEGSNHQAATIAYFQNALPAGETFGSRGPHFLGWA